MDKSTFYNDLVAVRKIDQSKERTPFLFVVPSAKYDSFVEQNITVPKLMSEKLVKGKTNPSYDPNIDAKVKFVEDNIEQWVAMLQFD